MSPPLTGLIAAPHTPFRTDGSLHAAIVDAQARHLAESGARGAFVAGTTGEGVSLSREEREELATRWVAAGHAQGLAVIVHVGHLALPEAGRLAAHAAEIGADAVAAMAPCYLKPPGVDELVRFFEPVAAAAAGLPFYFYDLPSFTGVSLPLVELLNAARERIPSLRGVKYTHLDLAGYQSALQWHDGAMDMLWGCDDMLLGALATGARGAVGSTYNFAAPLYLRLMAGFEAGDLEAARREQARSLKLITTLAGYGYPAAAKSVMALLGIDCGPVRPPLRNLATDEKRRLEAELRTLGFFDWIA